MPGGLMVAAMNTASKSAARMIFAPVRSSKLSTARSRSPCLTSKSQITMVVVDAHLPLDVENHSH